MRVECGLVPVTELGSGLVARCQLGSEHHCVLIAEP